MSGQEGVDEAGRGDRGGCGVADNPRWCPEPGGGPIGQLPTKDSPGDHTKDDHHAIPADDKAYRSALDGIPQIKVHDPWRSVREAPKTKSPR